MVVGIIEAAYVSLCKTFRDYGAIGDITVPIRKSDGVWRVQGATGLSPMKQHDGFPVGQFLPGWKPVAIHPAFSPILLLLLQHEDGQEAVWFLDESYRLIDHVFERLSDQTRARILEIALPALQRLRDNLLAGNPASEPIDPLQFQLLPADFLRLMISALGTRLVRPPINIDLSSISDDTRYLFIAGERFSKDRLNDSVMPALNEQHIGVMLGQSYSTICPFTGTVVYTDTTIFQDTISSCRFKSTDTLLKKGRIFYLSDTSGIDERELFIPDLNCSVNARAPQHGSIIFSLLLTSMIKSADILPTYFLSKKAPANLLPGYPGLHIGHMLWNEMSGLDLARRRVPADKLPIVLVQDTELGSELFGPVDSIFSEFIGKVRRIEAKNIAKLVYGENLSIMHVRDRWVSSELSSAIRRIANEDVAVLADKPKSVRIKEQGRHIVLIGLRVQNRTMPDQVAVWTHVIQRLVHRLGSLVIVIDGINSRLDGDPTTDYGMSSPQTDRPPILDELEIVIQLRERFRGNSVEIINTVGSPVARSIFWAERANFFIAIWGAGLAKYRWIANKRGLILTNLAFLLQKDGDLRIYSSPATMENPTEVEFINPKFVTDLEPHRRYHGNFSVDLVGLSIALDALIDGEP